MAKSTKDKAESIAKHVGAGFVGAIAGAALKKFSVFGAIGLIAAGVWNEIDELVTAGGGMMAGAALLGAGAASGKNQRTKDVPFMDQAKEDAMEFIKGAGLGLYLDKTPLAATLGLGCADDYGMGYADYFDISESPMMGFDEDMLALSAAPEYSGIDMI